jgi:hypothetical protein
MEYDVLEGCSAMDWSSWMIGDRAQECMLSAGARRRRRGKTCAFGVLYREVSYNSIVQMINGQLV